MQDKKVKLQSGNYRHPDGRIFESGDGSAITVSPYAIDFWDNIEEEIKPLIQALCKKGYLTYSSCAGHQAVKRRFVAVAFPSKELARKFVYDIKQLYKNKMIHFDIKYSTDYDGVDWLDIPSHTAFLNNLYYRGYEDYYFVEISIGRNTPPKLKNFFKILKKKFRREKITMKLVETINSEGFPDYEQ